MPSLFGEKLRHLRLQCGLTQHDLAHKLSVPGQTYVSNLEAGRKTPSLELVLRVGDLFGVTTDYLLRDTMPVEGMLMAVAGHFANHELLPRLVGEKLRTLRLQRHLSQRELTHQLRLTSRAYISNLEAGRKMPSLDLVVQIANLFGVTTDYLLRDSIPIAPPTPAP